MMKLEYENHQPAAQPCFKSLALGMKNQMNKYLKQWQKETIQMMDVMEHINRCQGNSSTWTREQSNGGVQFMNNLHNQAERQLSGRPM